MIPVLPETSGNSSVEQRSLFFSDEFCFFALENIFLCARFLLNGIASSDAVWTQNKIR